MLFNKENISKLQICKGFAKAKELEIEFYKMLRHFDNINQSKKIRVYKDNGVRDDLSLQLNKTFFSNFKDLNIFLSQEFNAVNYCVAISDIEKYTHTISDFFISKIIADWSKNLGEQLLGFELYSFLGKYKITPFGIHDDKEHTILVHIGPNPMRLYCWEKEYYESIAGKESTSLGNFKIDISNSQTNTYYIEPGDLIFIPKGMFHAIERADFSITLGAIPIPITPRKFSERFIQAKLSEVISQNFDFLNYKSADNIKSEITNLANTISNELKTIEFENEITREYHRLKSNGFLVNKCILKKSTNKEIQISKFKDVQLKKDLTHLLIYINGIELKIRHTDTLETLFQYLTKNKSITKEMVLNILGEDMNEDAAEKVYTLINSYT